MAQEILIGHTTDSAAKVILNLDVLITTRLLIQANSGGGKSRTIRRLSEQAFGKMQQIIIDPEGEFATLREKFGFVLVGPGGETPAHPKTAAVVAERLLELQASAVCDIYELPIAQRHVWVRNFLDAMMNAPKTLWHPCLVVVDEAHIYCPEKGQGESEALEAMTDLATRGRKRGFTAVFATQRLGKLAKNASAELQNRLIGPTFEDLDRERAAGLLGIPKTKAAQAEFNQTIQLLEPGSFFALGRAISLERILLHVGPVMTSHPEPGGVVSAPPPTPKAIAKLLPQLSDLPKEADKRAASEADLRAELASTRQRLALLEAQKRTADPEAIQKAVQKAVQKAAVDFDRQRQKDKQAWVRDLTTWLREYSGGPMQPFEVDRRAVEQPLAPPRKPAPAPRLQTDRNGEEKQNGDLRAGERQVLIACAMYPDGVTREQLGILTDYKRSSRDTYLKGLRAHGYVDTSGTQIRATDAGLTVLGDDYEPLPTGDALREYWLHRLTGGEGRLLQILVDAYPAAVSREELCEQSGYQRSSRDTYLKQLNARQLIEKSADGIKASANLFTL